MVISWGNRSIIHCVCSGCHCRHSVSCHTIIQLISVGGAAYCSIRISLIVVVVVVHVRVVVESHSSMNSMKIFVGFLFDLDGRVIIVMLLLRVLVLML